MMRFWILLVSMCFLSCGEKEPQQSDAFAISKSESQWRSQLSPEAFFVLRKAGTEPAYSSPLLNVSQRGTFVCAACGNPLYNSENEFDSGTGWPSFDRAMEGANVKFRRETQWGYSSI